MPCLAMAESIPDLLGINDRIGSRQLFQGEARVQIDANLLIGFIGELTAIECFLCFGIEKI